VIQPSIVRLPTTFLSKINANQLIVYLGFNSFAPSDQPGFRKNHFTESLLFRFLSDSSGAIGTGQISFWPSFILALLLTRCSLPQGAVFGSCLL